MAAPLKLNRVQLFDHSYVRRLKDFIRESDNFTFTWDLQGPPLIQYSGFPGADLNRLRNNIDVIEDFDPDVLFLFAGTNDLFHSEVTPSELAGQIVDFVKSLLFSLKIRKVEVMSITHRYPSS